MLFIDKHAPFVAFVPQQPAVPVPKPVKLTIDVADAATGDYVQAIKDTAARTADVADRLKAQLDLVGRIDGLDQLVRDRLPPLGPPPPGVTNADALKLIAVLNNARQALADQRRPSSKSSSTQLIKHGGTANVAALHAKLLAIDVRAADVLTRQFRGLTGGDAHYEAERLHRLDELRQAEQRLLAVIANP